jgi:outer membrane protein assembly factor BamB
LDGLNLPLLSQSLCGIFFKKNFATLELFKIYQGLSCYILLNNQSYHSMKYNLCSCLLLAVLFFSSHTVIWAQRNPDWTIVIPDNPQQILFQETMGIPILQTDKNYYAIDPATRQIAWKNTRYTGKIKSIAGKLDTEGSDFQDMYGTPYVCIQDNIIDSRNGNILLDKEKEAYKSVQEYEILPKLKAILVTVASKDNTLRLYLISLETNAILWKTDFAKIPKVEVTGITEDMKEPPFQAPFATTLVMQDSSLVYHNRRMLGVISPDGKVRWTTKCEPVEITLDPNGKAVIVVNALMTGLGDSPVHIRSIRKYKSPKISAFNLENGKEIWSEDIKMGSNIRWIDAHPRFLTVVDRKGCNLFDYSTGKALWTEGFKGKGVVEIQPDGENFLITFASGEKIMKVSDKGENLWKEPRILEEEEEDVENGYVQIFEYNKGRVLVDANKIRFKPTKESGLKKWRLTLNRNSLFAYDDRRGNIVLLHDGRIYVVNPDQNPEVYRSIRCPYSNERVFHTVEFRKDAYFFSGSQEFVHLNLTTDQATRRYYERPLDTKSMAGSLLDRQLRRLDIEKVETPQQEQRAYTGNPSLTTPLSEPGSERTVTVIGQPNQRDTRYGNAWMATSIPVTRRDVFQQGSDEAFYFTKRDKNNVLIRVNKDNGLEMDALEVDSNRPIYRLDDVQKRLYVADKDKLNVFELNLN